MAKLNWVQTLWRKVSGPGMVTPAEIEGSLHLPVLAIIPHLERRSRPPTGSQGLNSSQGSIMRRIDLEGRWRSRLLIHFPDAVPAAQAYLSLVKELHLRSRSQRQKVWLFAGS